MTTNSIYTVLGTCDDFTACELCGRDDLKSTVALRDNTTGEVVHYGSDCAARAAGWTEKGVRAAVKAAEVCTARHPFGAWALAETGRKVVYGQEIGFAVAEIVDRFGSMAAANEAYRKAVA